MLFIENVLIIHYTQLKYYQEWTHKNYYPMDIISTHFSDQGLHVTSLNKTWILFNCFTTTFIFFRLQGWFITIWCVKKVLLNLLLIIKKLCLENVLRCTY